MALNIAGLRKFPVLVGLQPIRLGWSKSFSPELLAQVDYVLMDPQTIPLGNGEFMHIWEFSTYVENTDEFMERYMAYSLEILRNRSLALFTQFLLSSLIAVPFAPIYADRKAFDYGEYSENLRRGCGFGIGTERID
jgi:hypothetical protein